MALGDFLTLTRLTLGDFFDTLAPRQREGITFPPLPLCCLTQEQPAVTLQFLFNSRLRQADNFLGEFFLGLPLFLAGDFDLFGDLALFRRL